jgi:ABC-2 type transport system ATP-binding protein
VRDHLRLRAHLKRLGRHTKSAVDRAMELAGVASEASRTIGVLSKGFRQRVGLADALLGEPPLLVLDEPTSGMDPIQVRELREHLIAAAKQRAVLVSSHAVSDLEPLAMRVAVLREGELVADDTAVALREETGTSSLEDAVVKLLAKPEAPA